MVLMIPALLGSLLVTMIVATTDARISKDRFFLRCFEASVAARTVTPSQFKVASQRFGQAYAHCPMISRVRSINPEDMIVADRLVMQSSDRLWRFWRGEWSEHYASPSGGTTLLATQANYWRAFSSQLLLWLVLSAGSLLCAWHVWPQRRYSISGSSSVSGI